MQLMLFKQAVLHWNQQHTYGIVKLFNLIAIAMLMQTRMKIYCENIKITIEFDNKTKTSTIKITADGFSKYNLMVTAH